MAHRGPPGRTARLTLENNYDTSTGPESQLMLQGHPLRTPSKGVVDAS